MTENDNILPSTSSDHRRKAATKVVDLMSTEWTDKKHSMYLDSIEASFVNQLYSSECRSKDFIAWLSRTQSYKRKSGSDPENQTFRQFKVLNRNFKFERAKSQDESDNESHPLSANLWIQRFRPHFISSKEQHLSPANEMENNELSSQSIQLMGESHGNKATSSKPLHFINCNWKYHQVSVGNMTEVSDQNFVDSKADSVEEFVRSNSSKRARPAISPLKDQVVPFVGQTLDEETKENDEVQ